VHTKGRIFSAQTNERTPRLQKSLQTTGRFLTANRHSLNL